MGEAWNGNAPTVGQIAERSRLVKPEYVQMFAEISGDFNPLHFDDRAAKASPFGELIVHGGITSSILNAVCAEELPGPGTVFLNTNWNYRAPVRPGDVITGTVEVLEVRQDKPITKLATKVTRQDDVVVLDGTALCYTMVLKPHAAASGKSR